MTPPAVIHLTHWKAGSQWVRAVLERAAPERPVVAGLAGAPSVPLVPGTIYTPAYMTRPRLDDWARDSDRRTFCVIRDLRDTLVSWYFSLLHTHPEDDKGFVVAQRAVLQRLPQDEGLIHLLESEGMQHMIQMQRSWIEGSDPVFKYEDLLADEQAVFKAMFDHCRLDVPDHRRRRAVAEYSFERLAHRARGVEDRGAHLRKGIAGDWRNHLTPALEDSITRVLGSILEAAGYADQRPRTPPRRADTR